MGKNTRAKEDEKNKGSNRGRGRPVSSNHPSVHKRQLDKKHIKKGSCKKKPAFTRPEPEHYAEPSPAMFSRRDEVPLLDSAARMKAARAAKVSSLGLLKPSDAR